VDRPRQPAHQVRHICKAHKADTQKPTLQKSLPCSYASGTHPASLDTYFQFKVPRRRANIQHWVCFYAGRRSNNELHIAISYYPADEFLFSFLLLTSTSVFQLGCGSGLDIIKYQHSSKPYRCLLCW
jgi:hypothetical protein